MDALSICSIGWGLNLITMAVTSKVGGKSERNVGRFVLVALLTSTVPFLFTVLVLIGWLFFVFKEHSDKANKVLSHLVFVLGLVAGVVLLLHGLFL